MLQVGLDGRPHIHQELLELGVLGGRESAAVQRADHRRVIRHFTVDVRLVERLALERLDGRASLGGAL